MNKPQTKKTRKGILIDTLLYNPLHYVYNINLQEKTVNVYSVVNEKVYTKKLKKHKAKPEAGYYCICDKDYIYLDYLFEIEDKHWDNRKSKRVNLVDKYSRNN